MQRHDNLEQRLSSLSLTHASDSYQSEGNLILETHTPTTKSLWPMRLNYALGLCLLLSVSFNVIQFADHTDTLAAATDQCELNGAMPDSPMSPVAAKPPLYEKPLSNTVTSVMLC